MFFSRPLYNCEHFIGRKKFVYETAYYFERIQRILDIVVTLTLTYVGYNKDIFKALVIGNLLLKVIIRDLRHKVLDLFFYRVICVPQSIEGAVFIRRTSHYVFD